MRKLLLSIPLLLPVPIAAQNLTDELIGTWTSFMSNENGSHIMTLGIQSLSAGSIGYLIYSGEVSCGAEIRIAQYDKSQIVFQAITESGGIRFGQNYYGKCSHQIRRKGQFLGRSYGWELDNDEWRVTFDLSSNVMKIFFDGHFIAEGPFQKISNGS